MSAPLCPHPGDGTPLEWETNWDGSGEEGWVCPRCGDVWTFEIDGAEFAPPLPEDHSCS